MNEKKVINWYQAFEFKCGPFTLGQEPDRCRKILKSNGCEYEEEASGKSKSDFLFFHLQKPRVTLCFTIGDERLLGQIEVYDPEIQLNNERLIGLDLVEAINRLGLQNQEKTVWCDQLIETPFDSDLIAVAEKPEMSRQFSILLLGAGTLWLVDRGLGLIINNGVVDGVAIRQRNLIPNVGSGPLSVEQLELLQGESFLKQLELARKKEKLKNQPWIRLSPRRIWLIATLSWIVLGGIFLYRSHQKDEQVYAKWSRAIEKVGVVTAAIPEEAFPEAYRIEYVTDSNVTRSVEKKWSDAYSEIRPDKTIVLRYLPGEPIEVKTFSEVRELSFFKRFPNYLGIAFVFVGVTFLLIVLTKTSQP